MRRVKGFTLIELMIVVAVVAVLAAIVLPSYREQIRKSRRADAARAIGELQLGLERWRAENPSYANCAGAACASASGIYPTTPTSSYYTITPAPLANDYTITAAPTGAQAGDRCGNLVATRNTKPTWATADCNN